MVVLRMRHEYSMQYDYVLHHYSHAKRIRSTMKGTGNREQVFQSIRNYVLEIMYCGIHNFW